MRTCGAKPQPFDVLDAFVKVTNGVRVSAEHKVGEPDVIRSRDVGARNLLEQPILVQIHGVERGERSFVIARQNVQAADTNLRAVPERGQNVTRIKRVPFVRRKRNLSRALALEHAHDVALIHQRL